MHAMRQDVANSINHDAANSINHDVYIATPGLELLSQALDLG